MAHTIKVKNTVIGLLVAVFATTLFAQKPRDISGTVIGVDGEKVAKTTVILMADDGTEVKREETSRRGAFKFKKVAPGNYTVEIDAGAPSAKPNPYDICVPAAEAGAATAGACGPETGTSTRSDCGTCIATAA